MCDVISPTAPSRVEPRLVAIIDIP